jgi:hypothetical protein
MNSDLKQVYSNNVIEFVAVANEFCKYMDNADEISGDEMLRIMQRILPLLYLKASLLPSVEPYFDDGNEKFVTEEMWFGIHDTLEKNFGTANEYLEVFDEKINETDRPVISSLAENMADIYQDLKDFLLLYQTGTQEVMNDALWECRMNFENYWGQKLTNSLRAVHKFIYSGEEIGKIEKKTENRIEGDKSEWFIARRQKEFRKNGKF